MKIALCLHGLFSSTTDVSSRGMDGYNYIKKHILSKGDVDVYIHSWDVEKQELIKELYQPKKCIFEEQHNFNDVVIERGLDKIERCPRSPQSVFSHLYSVTEAVKMVYESGEEYDVVIKARFDLGMINAKTSGPFNSDQPYPVQCLTLVDDVHPDKLYTANWNHFHMGPADMWFYGSMKTMKPFTTLFQSFDESMYVDSEFHKFATQIENNPGDIAHAVAFYKYWFIKNNLWEDRVNVDSEYDWPIKRSIVVYTHTDMADVWDPFFSRLNQYMHFCRVYVFVNKKDDRIPKEYIQITYDDTKKYTERLKECLLKIDEYVFLFIHEDMILYSTPDYGKLQKYYTYVEHKSVDSIKLIYCGDGNGIKASCDDTLVFNDFAKFSIQPTIIRKDILLQIASNVGALNIWDFENAIVGSGMDFMAFNGTESKRGMYHYNSFVFPYIATAINKGKWNMTEYSNELDVIFEEYNINPFERGIW